MTIDQVAMDGFGSPQEPVCDGPISRFLHAGQHNAVNISYLQVMTGMKNRDVRLLIEKERRGGTPILSDNASGYYLPATLEEIARCVRSMRHRAKEIERTADAIERGQLP